MTKYTLIAWMTFTACGLIAQESQIFGTTTFGGESANGTIFKIHPSTPELEVTRNGLETPFNGYIEEATMADNDKIYGISFRGGANDEGVLFEFNPSNGSYLKLMNLSFGAGKHIEQISNGKIVGTIEGTSENPNIDVLFEYDIDENEYTELVTFQNGNGESPGRFIESENGVLYGTTREGGQWNQGTIYSYDTNNGTFAVLYNFNDVIIGQSPSGKYPTGGYLHFDGIETLYGLAYEGGPDFFGVLYSFNINSNEYTVVKSFGSDEINEGYRPNSGLVQSINGKLYGFTHGGGIADDGILFEFDPSNDVFLKKLDFDINQDIGQAPWDDFLLHNSIGLLSSNGRNIFEYNPLTETVDILYTSDPTDPNYFSMSHALLIASDDGNIFHPQVQHWSNEAPYKGFMKFNPSDLNYTLFGEPLVIESHYSQSIMQASNGYLYGTAQPGVIFKFNPNSYEYIEIPLPDGIILSQEAGSFMEFTEGFAYIFSQPSSGSSYGSICLFDIENETISTLIDFGGTPIGQGSGPQGTPLLAENGHVYGTTTYGGAFGNGVLFEYIPDLNVIVEQVDFSEFSTQYRFGLMQASNSLIYGSYNGDIFKYNPNNSEFSTVTTTPDFFDVRGTLVEHSDGLLYGFGSNSIYTLNPTSEEFNILYNFSNHDIQEGGAPHGKPLIYDNDMIYGLAAVGGDYSVGAVFQYQLSTGIYQKLFDITPSFGGVAHADIPIISVNTDPTLGIPNLNSNSLIKLFPNPSKKDINITFPQEEKSIKKLYIYDELGRLVDENQIEGSHIKYKTNLANGVYIVRIEFGQSVISKRVVIL